MTSMSDILASMSNVGLDSVMKSLQDYQLQPTQSNVAAFSAESAVSQSPYKFNDWLTAKGYDYSYDSNNNSYTINGIELPGQLTNTLQNGYASESVYENLLTSYQELSNQQQQQMQPTGTTETGEYKSPYEQEINQILEELKNITPYQTPEELQQYLYNLLQSANQPFTYDPTQDQALIQAQKLAAQKVQEAASSKGTLYSSGTIGQTALQQAALIPQYEAAQYQRFADQKNRELSMVSTLMQWDAMQADRYQDQLDLVKTKFDYIMKLDAQNFQKFQVMLEQRNFDREYQLEQQSLQLQRQIQEIDAAYKRVEAIGYVDNNTAIVLGMPVGTPAQWVKELELAQQQELERIKKEHENSVKLQKDQAKIEKDLIKYKNELDTAAQKKLMQEQYEYDKKLADYEHTLNKDIATGKGLTASAAGIIATGKSLLGLKYVYGGESTTSGMDCSAFTQWAFKQHGIDISRTTQTQVKEGTYVSKSDLQPGDLVFFNTTKANGHVGIYVGNGQVMHASSYYGKVVINDMNSIGQYSQARRIISGSSSSSKSTSSGSGNVVSPYSSTYKPGSTGKNWSGMGTSEIQRALNDLGIKDANGKKLDVDGAYGPLTSSAVAKLQKKLGITSDGWFGPETEKALKAYMKKNTGLTSKNYYDARYG
jgi:cell wall-associated NlpC family hydrolase